MIQYFNTRNSWLSHERRTISASGSLKCGLPGSSTELDGGEDASLTIRLGVDIVSTKDDNGLHDQSTSLMAGICPCFSKSDLNIMRDQHQHQHCQYSNSVITHSCDNLYSAKTHRLLCPRILRHPTTYTLSRNPYSAITHSIWCPRTAMGYDSQLYIVISCYCVIITLT